MTEYITRMGDGRTVSMTREQIYEDAMAGMADGVDAAMVPDLTQDDIDQIVDVICTKSRIVGVERGREVILTEDGGPHKFILDSGSCCNGVEMGRIDTMEVIERAIGFDTFELTTTDYSIKPVKPIVGPEMTAMQQAAMRMTVPTLYGAMPNMGLYYAPDGAHSNPADLMREFKIEEAQQNAEAAADQLSRDIVYVSESMISAGADGFNFDTTGSAGDAEFVATLRGVEQVRKDNPNAYITMGMSAENVLGIHGEIQYDGKVVAGLYPNEQVKLCEKAGASIFGAVVNTNTSRSFAWNVARSAVIIKDCVKNSNIPVHANMGMGVGGVPMLETPPLDCVTRASKIMAEVAGVDGI